MFSIAIGLLVTKYHSELTSKKLNFAEIIKQSDELVPYSNCLGGYAGIISFKDKITHLVNDF